MKLKITNKIGDIVRAKSDHSYTHIYLKNGKETLITQSLNHIEALLIKRSNKFFRASRTHLIHTRFIDSITYDCHYVAMKDGTKIPIAKNKKQSFLTKIFKK